MLEFAGHPSVSGYGLGFQLPNDRPFSPSRFCEAQIRTTTLDPKVARGLIKTLPIRGHIDEISADAL